MFHINNKHLVKYWETPLRKISFLTIFDSVLNKSGIKLVLQPIDYIHDFMYNTNLLLPLRQINNMMCLVLNFESSKMPNELEFDTKFCEFLDRVAKKSLNFCDMVLDDIIIYYKELVTQDPIVLHLPSFGDINFDLNPTGNIQSENSSAS